MGTTSSERAAAGRAPGLRWRRGLAVAVLAAALSGTPWLARAGVAQQTARIRAAARVTTSYLGARLRPDTAVVVAGVPQALVQHFRLEGLGVLDVQTGPGEQIRVGSRRDEPAGRSSVVVQVAYVST
jgi:hypothetical protein